MIYQKLFSFGMRLTPKEELLHLRINNRGNRQLLDDIARIPNRYVAPHKRIVMPTKMYFRKSA